MDSPVNEPPRGCLCASLLICNSLLLVVLAVNFCSSNPCLNNGTCVSLTSDFQCQCSPGWQGKDCGNGWYYMSITTDPCLPYGTKLLFYSPIYMFFFSRY